MMAPKPRAFEQQSPGKRSQKHEKRIAVSFEGRTLPRSGGLAPSKWTKKHTAGGDIKTKHFLIEHKLTEKASMSLKRDWLNKVTSGAGRKMTDPAIVITFAEGLDKPEDWVLIQKSVFERLIRNQGK